MRRRLVSLIVTLCLLLVQTAAIACVSDGCDDSHASGGADLCHCCQIGDRCAGQVASGVGPPPEAALLGQFDRLLPSRIDFGTDDFVIGALLFPDPRGPPLAD